MSSRSRVKSRAKAGAGRKEKGVADRGRSSDVLVYAIGDCLYVNLTGSCTAHCVFCRRETAPVAAGHDLTLRRDHAVEEYLREIGDPARYAQIVFCGFGEPTLRLPDLLRIARWIRARGGRVRLNTNGHGNLIHGRDIVPDLAACVDEVSVSINAADAATYLRLVRPDHGAGAFSAALSFVSSCAAHGIETAVTAVALPGLDLEPCRRLARRLGASFRARPYEEEVGNLKRLTQEGKTCPQ